MSRFRLPSKQTVLADFSASLVVFLVAVPLCVGVAVASGVPAELGMITGIVGGLVVGFMPGSTMQVSGPAAGLTVVVSSAVAQHGLATLGIIVLISGLLQVLLGISRLGSWFRAISPAVVQGMLAGIGLVLILGQIYPFGGQDQPTSTGEKFSGVPGLLGHALTTPTGLASLGLGLATLVLLGVWKKLPKPLSSVPGPLVAVVLASAAAAVLALPVSTVEVGSLLQAVNVPFHGGAFGELLSPALWGTVVTFTLVASAESLFSAAAVDRMHSRPKTQYNKELAAQGVGNAVCGVFGALPMTAVIVRSSTNVNAGAVTKLSRILHGAWLLLFVVLLPQVLAFIPNAVLAALLIQAGWKLVAPRDMVELMRTNRPEAVVLLVTTSMIVATDLLVGTLTGLALAVIKSAFEMSRLSVRSHHDDERNQVRVELGGNATFLRLPRLLDHLEQLPSGRHVRLDLTGVRHLDHACQQAVENWAHQRRGEDDHEVDVALPHQRGQTDPDQEREAALSR
ncbi:SulP family inorganic anion transporter [Salinifilum ghardaiensis]